MRRMVAVALAFMLAVTLAGCLEVHRPEVPANIVTTADVRWQVTYEGVIEDSTFAPKAVETIYTHDPEDGDTYPARLYLIGLRTITELDEQDLLDIAEDILIEKMAEEGIEPDTITKQEGSRTIDNGASTRWITMLGNVGDDAILFSEALQIRTAAEVWYDPPSKMHVIAIAIAQTGGTTIIGEARTELTAWNELVGDPDGSIGGAHHLEGFMDHVEIRS